MKKIIALLIAISVGTTPLLLLLLVWNLTFLCLGNRTLSDPAAISGVFAGPLLFPFVIAGTVVSCRRSIPIRRRPLVITLGVISIGLTGFTILFWWGISQWGPIG
jgi:hypothetical protein